MNTPRIAINPSFIEVDKPSGGGKGPDALYPRTVLIDDVPALFLTRENFKRPGQMQAFLDAVERLSALEESSRK